MTGVLESFLPEAKLVCPLALLYIPSWRFCQNHEFAKTMSLL
jgi:hypothetical protein